MDLEHFAPDNDASRRAATMSSGYVEEATTKSTCSPRRIAFAWRMHWTTYAAMLTARRAPLLGEHNAEVLGRWLGMSVEELTALQKKKVI